MSNAIPANIAQCLNYQTGMFLTSAYMTLEQHYVRNALRLQNQYLYTPGVLSGMLVTVQNNTMSVGEGVAFDGLGNFLILPGASGNPVSVPANPTNPFVVCAMYPDTSAATTPVVNRAAHVTASATVPANGVLLATVTIDANNTITMVTDSRVPVASRLPAVLSSTPETTGDRVQLSQSLQGVTSVPSDALQALGASVAVTVDYLPSHAAAFAQPPTVMVSVLGAIPYAVAVVPDLMQFVVTLTAVQAAPPSAPTVELSWIALANPIPTAP